MEVLLFWIAFAVLVGVFASIRRNRSGFGWFLLALVISPLLGGILVAILMPLPDEVERRTDSLTAFAFDQLPAAEQARINRLGHDLGAVTTTPH